MPKGIRKPLSLYESNLQAFGIHCCKTISVEKFNC